MAGGYEENAESLLSFTNSEHIINTRGHSRHLKAHCNLEAIFLLCQTASKSPQELTPACPGFSSSCCNGLLVLFDVKDERGKKKKKKKTIPRAWACSAVLPSIYFFKRG